MFFLPAYAQAAAWTLEKGSAKLITSLTYYNSNEFSNHKGDKQHQTDFTKWEINPLVEYGIKSDLTFGVSPRLQYARQNQQGRNIDLTALSSVDIYLRKRLFTNERWVVSLQNLIELPGIHNSSSSLIDTKTTDLESRILFGYSFPMQGQYHFTNFEVAYRARINGISDEFHADSTLGIRFSEQWLLLMQSFNTLAVAGALGNNATSLTNSSGFDLSKTQLSMVYALTPRISLQAGVLKDLWGRNTGIGDGVLTAIWVDF